MQIKKNFLDSKIQLNLDDLVIVCMHLPQKETLGSVWENMILICMCPNKGFRELGHYV